ncbi:Bicoid-interacting protein 3-domain-containing protein [Crucibulum laeve]|uniref:RNA methyltransferase n=1 Tax=Crucibulum laeve TaxID=68775 RepID=A0A5C3MA50_9AGAR|nr:Bicoid-interacting protein 3-domain-containing protein [Crucibulum laeve]
MSKSITVPIHGNYHGYYSKRPTIKDTRLALLPPTLFAGKRVLDIGCNEGWVTCEIAQSWGAHKVVGVDIDDVLIQHAWRRRRAVWSLQAPSDPSTSTSSSAAHLEVEEVSTGSKKRKRKHEPFDATVIPSIPPDYFPASCEHEFGSLPIPPSILRGKHVFPYNLSFRTADWTRTEIPEDSEGYDVVAAFSISKWIHLNDGDEGLRHFFMRIHKVLKTGGTFVLEPQPWDSYAKAKRMNEILKENAKNLTIRPDDFESILHDIGFVHTQHFGAVGEGGFHRPVDLYVKERS